MFENGFDVGHVIRHPVFLVTFIIAIPAWIVAFAGQCAAEAQYTSQSTYTQGPVRLADYQPDQIGQ
jgi:K+ transporter